MATATSDAPSPRSYIPSAFRQALDDALIAIGEKDAFDNANSASEVVRIENALIRAGYSAIALRLDCNMPNCFSL